LKFSGEKLKFAGEKKSIHEPFENQHFQTIVLPTHFESQSLGFWNAGFCMILAAVLA
jgi:hypothetical protein